MAKEPKRDDSWDGISPLFASIMNDPEIAESERQTNRTFWILGALCALALGAFLIAEWLWGDAFTNLANLAVMVLGGAVMVGVVVLIVLAIFQKPKA